MELKFTNMRQNLLDLMKYVMMNNVQLWIKKCHVWYKISFNIGLWNKNPIMAKLIIDVHVVDNIIIRWLIILHQDQTYHLVQGLKRGSFNNAD